MMRSSTRDRASALREFRLFESTDLEETRESISRVMQPHQLKPGVRGTGRSHMDFVRIGNLGLGTIAFGDEMCVDVNAVDGYYLMMFCLAGHARVIVAGEQLLADRTNAVLCAPGKPFHAELSVDCEQLVLRIDAASSGAIGHHNDDAWLPHVRLDGEPLRAWTQQLQMLIESPHLIKRTQENPCIAGHLEGLLIEMLLSGHSQNCEEAKDTRISPAYVRRAIDFIAARSTAPLRVADIANAVGLSERALRNGFRHFKGLTPMQYVQKVRLELARDMLRRAGRTAQVTDIALACGFTHLGRFSAMYKARFGESPSETARHGQS